MFVSLMNKKKAPMTRTIKGKRGLNHPFALSLSKGFVMD